MGENGTEVPLAERECRSGRGAVERLDAAAVAALRARLHPDWRVLPGSAAADAGDGAAGEEGAAPAIERRFAVKGFARALYLANAVAYLADRQNHHPDIAFGFGYCRVRYSTHDVDGLSENDFVCAAKLDRLFERGG